ncbi:unnamed protein product [Dovyalis caffra]|uniref:RING-CH-type domain-containing protein n=1 Tax=Dovyalis caffra TaxID=77055 RepID=A0AAV1SUQ2_9ROSI|nr:unnamed protein product [Dovyalis caffra]
MQNDVSDRGSTTRAGDLALTEVDLEKQDNSKVMPQEGGNGILSGNSGFLPVAIVVSNGESPVTHVVVTKEELPGVDSPKKGSLSRTSSSHEQCRVCQQEKEEVLIDLGCKCKGGLAKSHRTCIDTWFSTRGSNKCEICQTVAVNVSPPESQPSVGILLLGEKNYKTNYWVWRIDPDFRPRGRDRGCFSPLWVAFSILIGGLLLDVLISITLGVSALPVNIIIGVIVVLGLGTALRLALEFCHEWSFSKEKEDNMVAVVSVDSLPLGFRFRPTDEELISHYLRLKINGRDSEVEVIPEIDVCKWEPWDLPGLSVIKTADPDYEMSFCAVYTTMLLLKLILLICIDAVDIFNSPSFSRHLGQAAYVLFRLFKKPEGRTDIVKYDEIEQNGYSPAAAKSSPDDASSDLVEETATPDMHSGKQSEDIKMWMIESDNMTSNIVVPVDSCSNSHATSDVEDQMPEATAVEAYPPLDENSLLHEPVSADLDCKVFSPMRSHIPADLGYYINSPYASDFGNNQNGFPFQDGTSEQDVSLTELLDDFFNNNDECSGEETTSRNNLGTGSEAQLSDQIPPGNFDVKDNDINSFMNNAVAQAQHASQMGAPAWPSDQFGRNELLQMQPAVGTWRAPASVSYGELGRGNIGHFGNNFLGQDAPSANSAISSFGVLNSIEEATSQITSVDYGNGVSGTGIKIRTRQPQVQPHSDNFVAQGSAPRRIRLQMKLSVDSVGDCKAKDAAHLEDEDEVQSAVTEATGYAEKQPPTVDDLQKESPLPGSNSSREIAEESSSNLRLRMKKEGESESRQIASSAFPAAPPAHHGHKSLSVYISVFILVIAFIAFTGIWRSLKTVKLLWIQNGASDNL